MSLEQRLVYFKIKESRFVYSNKSSSLKLFTYYTNNINKHLYEAFLGDIDIDKEMKIYKETIK